MIQSGVKAEIQALNTLGNSFLTDVYISKKIEMSDWK